MPTNFGAPPNPFASSAPMNPLQTITQAVQPAAQPQCNIIWVDGQEDVLKHPTSPNELSYFSERNNSVIWVRETDSNGNIKNPLHRLTYTSEEVVFGPESKFVTKEEHEKLYKLVEDMSATIRDLAKKWE